MFYIPNIRYHLKILTEDEVKDFSAVNFRECFNYTREKLYIDKAFKFIHEYKQ